MILFDITRFLNKRYSSSPTGIDRVSLRYLHYFLSENQDTIYFVQQKRKQIEVISKDYVNEFYNQVVKTWGLGNSKSINYNVIAKNIIDCPEQYSDIIKNIDPQHKLSSFTYSDSTVLDQFYNRDYEDRLESLMNADLSSLIGKHFAWFSKMPTPVKTMIFNIAAYSRINALICLKIGRLIGHLFDPKNIKTIISGYYVKFKHQKSIKYLLNILKNKDENEPVIYINTSQYLLIPNKLLDDYAKTFNIKYVFFIHDLLQLEIPEYFSRNWQSLYKQFIDTAIHLDASFVFNSQCTKESFLKYKNSTNKEYTGCTIVNHIGIEKHFQDVQKLPGTLIKENYFVIISTIEPRKNHLLLLNIWRTFNDCGMKDIPKLFIIGNRGWENENIIDMLERCPGLVGNVFEFSHLNDALLVPILSNAQALLCPSFYEGWGMPVVEALAMKVPVICSEIPALREAGQNIPEYIDPLDGIEWMRTIIEYSNENSEMRKAQLKRMHNLVIPSWEQHYTQLTEFIHDSSE